MMTHSYGVGRSTSIAPEKAPDIKLPPLQHLYLDAPHPVVVLRSSQVLRRSRRYVERALPLYVANALAPPLLILILSRSGSFVYSLLAPLVAYEALCLLSLAILLAGRGALAEYSLEPARKLLAVAGILGVATAFVAGGLMVLRAGRDVALVLEQSRPRERVKKSGEAS